MGETLKHNLIKSCFNFTFVELESLESNGARPIDILRDVPALKKAIHNLMNDLTKVKRMARFH